MPRYPWLHTNTIDEEMTPAKIRAMIRLGVPYPDGYDQQALADMHKQAQVIADDLKANESQLLLGENGIQANQEIIALIAYMQKLGADIEIVQSSNLTPKP
jgi:cytochrome c oxidase cbb3-type subunit I/II